jgi:hypothetical protein
MRSTSRFTRAARLGLAVGCILAGLAACNDGPTLPDSSAKPAGVGAISLQGMIRITEDVSPRVALEVSADQIVLLVGSQAAGLEAEVGHQVIVTGQYIASGEFAVDHWEKPTEGDLYKKRG